MPLIPSFKINVHHIDTSFVDTTLQQVKASQKWAQTENTRLKKVREQAEADRILNEMDPQHMIVFLMMTRAQQIQQYISSVAQEQGNLEVQSETLAGKLDELHAARVGAKKTTAAQIIEELKASPSGHHIISHLRSDGYNEKNLKQLSTNEHNWWALGWWDYDPNRHKYPKDQFGRKLFNIDPTDAVIIKKDLLARAKAVGFDIEASVGLNKDATFPLHELGEDYVTVNAYDLAKYVWGIKEADLKVETKTTNIPDDTRQWFEDNGFNVPASNADKKLWDQFEEDVTARLENSQNQMQESTRQLTKLTHDMTQYMEISSQMESHAHRQMIAWVNALRI